MKTNIKGEIATAKVICDLSMKGFGVFIPISEHGKVDLIALKDSKVIRLQIKYSKTGLISCTTVTSSLKGNKHSKYQLSDFDYYAVYLPTVDKVVYPSIKLGGIYLRVSESNTNTMCHWYEDFLDFTDNATLKLRIKK